MKKLERRALLCMLLAAFLLIGLGIFVVRFTKQGADWATYYFNSHIYTEGHLSTGRIYDRNGSLMIGNDKKKTTYESSKRTRKATAHAVGDGDGAVATGAQTVYKDKLVGYNILTGTYSVTGGGNDITLSIDKDICRAAYDALDGRDGCVGVMNYETGELICMVSTPSFDYKKPPSMKKAKSGTFMNKFLIATMTPGSIFKLVTTVAAIETYDDLSDWTYNCKGSRDLDGNKITCTAAHGEVDIHGALAHSCNCAFSELAVEVGAKAMEEYTRKAGLMTSYNMDGIENAEGSFEFPKNDDVSLSWAGIGQWKDQLNPCSMLVFISAIARDGVGVVPQMVRTPLNGVEKTDRMMEENTAARLRKMMKNNVKEEYGEYNYPGLDLYAKTGTAEVGGGESNAWFAGFIKNEGYPYAFIVCVEKGGYGSTVAGPVANTVLQEVIRTDSAAE